MSTFLTGANCKLRILEDYEDNFRKWTDGVMGSLTLDYTLTGSVPMKWMDIRDEWKRELEAGAIIFGIYDDRRGLVGTSGLYTWYPVYDQAAFRIIIWDKDAVGRGIGSEVTWMVTDYGFRALNCHRVWLGVHEDNLGAIKVYERTGYKLEGVERDAIYCYGKFSAAKKYAMLRPEWEAECVKRKMKTTGRVKDYSDYTA